jgi:hypothetical protein
VDKRTVLGFGVKCWIVRFIVKWSEVSRTVCVSCVLLTCVQNCRHYIGTLKPQWSLYVPPGLSIKYSTFCPHGVFMCFLWIWEQTTIISLYSNNWLVCITETECVHCAVRTGCLYIILVMCFVWIWEQTAIISLYSINWFALITDKECVYCAVRNEPLKGRLNISWSEIFHNALVWYTLANFTDCQLFIEFPVFG